MPDFPNSAGGAGSVRYINPHSLYKNPAFTNVVVVEGNLKTVHIGGQDAINASGEIVGKGDIVAQTEQVLANVRAALAAGGAEPEHIIKWNILISCTYRLVPRCHDFVIRHFAPRSPSIDPR